MYNLQKNNYHQKPKASNIKKNKIKNFVFQTPFRVSQFIFELLKDKFPKWSSILDPCCGEGNLLKPWNWYRKNYFLVYGIDQKKSNWVNIQTDFLSWNGEDGLNPKLILCNPPFNGYGHKLGSEVWLDQIIELFGKEVPIVLFAPLGFRLNGKKNGKRWSKFTNDKYPPISAIISLPLDIFPEVEFHSEILIFNIKGLQSHYFFNPHEI